MSLWALKTTSNASQLGTMSRAGGRGFMDELDADSAEAVRPIEVLGHVAGRLAGAVRGIDTVARYSGDEFVILLPALESPEEIAVIAARILSSFDPECLVGESQLRVELAVGQAVTDAMRPMLPGAREELARQLLMEADADMYRTKPRAESKLETSDAM